MHARPAPGPSRRHALHACIAWGLGRPHAVTHPTSALHAHAHLYRRASLYASIYPVRAAVVTQPVYNNVRGGDRLVTARAGQQLRSLREL